MMATALAVPADAVGGRYSDVDDHLRDDRDLLDRGPAQEVIGEMARRTLTFSSRRASASNAAGGSIATSERSCMR